MSRPSLRPVVLLAEDSEDDAFFFRWSLRKIGVDCQLVHATDGAGAIDYLERCRSADGAGATPAPDLVFLDLKMPALNGFEVLEWLQAHPFSPPLDVAVLSGSEHATDVARARQLGASAYFVKPMPLERLRERFAAWELARSRSPDRGSEPAPACAAAVTVT